MCTVHYYLSIYMTITINLIHCAIINYNFQIDACTAPPYAPAHSRRHQRAPGVSVLPQDILLLLLVETTLPRQARAVRHAVRVRVLPPEVQDQELADHAQESAAPRLQRHAEAAAEDVGAAQRAGPGAAPPVRPRRRRPRAAAAARPPMTADDGLNRCLPSASRACPVVFCRTRTTRGPDADSTRTPSSMCNINGLCQNNAGIRRILWLFVL